MVAKTTGTGTLPLLRTENVGVASWISPLNTLTVPVTDTLSP